MQKCMRASNGFSTMMLCYGDLSLVLCVLQEQRYVHIIQYSQCAGVLFAPAAYYYDHIFFGDGESLLG